MAQRHDGVRNLLTSLIGKVCTNVEVEPQLQPLDNERFNLRTAVTSPEARLDFKAGGFWSRGVTAFFDVRVTHVNSKCNQGKATSTIFKAQEEEKMRKYQKRVLDVEMGSFTPLVFGTNCGMGADCNCFLKRLAEKLSKDNSPTRDNFPPSRVTSNLDNLDGIIQFLNNKVDKANLWSKEGGVSRQHVRP